MAQDTEQPQDNRRPVFLHEIEPYFDPAGLPFVIAAKHNMRAAMNEQAAERLAARVQELEEANAALQQIVNPPEEEEEILDEARDCD